MLIAVLLFAHACGDSRSVGTTAPTPIPATSGISGIVHRGPSCPVEQEGVECPLRPTVAEVSVRRGTDDQPVATGRSGADGRFTITVAPGSYFVQAASETGEQSKPVEVSVTAGQFTEVTLTVDTGVR